MSTKHLLSFKTEADYKTAKKNHLIRPSISYIKESGNAYINDRFTTREKAEAGTVIAFHEHTSGEKEIKYIIPEAFDKNDPYWVADAIVVVPYSHTGDGTVRAMALNYANADTPDTGGTHGSSTLLWGADILILSPILNTQKVCSFTDYTNQTVSSFDEKVAAFLPSDLLEGEKINPYDTETFYTSGPMSVDQGYAPSPYNQDGSKNEAYHSIGAFANAQQNVLRDMNGRSNTLAILNALDTSTLAIALYDTTIPNTETINNDQPMFPAACACARYSSILKPCIFDSTKSLEENIQTMPWYFPSAGELGYSVARCSRIKYAMEQVGAPEYCTEWEWTSSLQSNTTAWAITSGTGSVNGASKKIPSQVRPFTTF